jgi:putative transposase
MAVMVTAAAGSDPAGAHLLLTQLGGACKKLRLIWVNGTYRGQLGACVAHHLRFVRRVTLRPAGCTGFVLLPRRWVVERSHL